MKITRNSGFSRVMAIVMMFGIVAGSVALAAGSGSRPRLSSDSNGITNDGITTTFPGGLCSIVNSAGILTCRGFVVTLNDIHIPTNNALYLNGATNTAFIYFDGTNTNIAAAGGAVAIGARLTVGTDVSFVSFTDDSATTGNRTVNKARGFSAIAAATSTITITNTFVTTSSQVVATLMTNDATAILKNCVPASGSFTCNLTANATGTTKIAWTVFN